MKFLKYVLPLLFLSLGANATLNEVDKANLAVRNILKNPGFELGKTYWTASGGTFAITTSGSNLLDGSNSATWDSSAASQTLSVTSITIPNGMKGLPGIGFCKIMTPSGTATHTIDVTDGTNTLSSTSIFSNTNPQRSYAYFIFPTSGSVVLRLSSVASNEPSVTIDDCYLGPAAGVTLGELKPQDVFSAAVSSADAVSGENVDWINGNCTNATTGKATCVFNTGIFSVAPNCTVTGSSATDGRIATIESLTSSQVIVTTTDDTGALADIGFQISCQKAGVDTPSVGFKADSLANSWSGYHDNTCSWARTNAAYGDPTADATCALVERANRNFGTVTTYTVTNPEPGIVFTPKRAGLYWVCAFSKVQGGTANSGVDVRLWDGTTTIAETSRRTTNAGDPFMHPLCGLISVTSTASKTISVQTAASTGSVTIAADSVGINASAIEWSIIQIDQSFPQVIGANGFTNWTSYTPTTAGMGTPTNVDAWYRCEGNSVHGRGSLKAGTVTATTGLIGLPNSYTINTGKGPANQTALVGHWVGNITTTAATLSGQPHGWWPVFIKNAVTGSVALTSDVDLSNDATDAFYVASAFNGISATSAGISWDFLVPINEACQ